MIRNEKILEWSRRQENRDVNQIVKILGVDYAYLILPNKADLYVTGYGISYVENLRPENFLTDKDWFDRHAIQLSGSSMVYKVRTKEVNHRQKDIVVKWNRMGQEVPGAMGDDNLSYAEFNSPFEEFSLVMELRETMRLTGEELVIQRPLAIYVPEETTELWQTGRNKQKMQFKIRSHRDVDLDMHRLYAVIYEWIEGIDSACACQNRLMEESLMSSLVLDAESKMKKQGFFVQDNKPQHIIVRPKSETDVVRRKNNDVLYGLVDFELLTSTMDRKDRIAKQKRAEYHKRQRDRFQDESATIFHPHLQHVNFFGVDYIYGHVESTKGRLWVVGKDAYLFDYFLPERWEQTAKMKLSAQREIYYTVTKDNIHVVWKLSKAGLIPEKDPAKEDEKKALDCGYNSPFEEVGFALELSRKGVASIYPRAIYMSGAETKVSQSFRDPTRYRSHEKLRTPDGRPIMEMNRDYIVLWGYWNGPDEKLATQDGDYYEGLSALRAYFEGVIQPDEYFYLLQVANQKLATAGIEDLNWRGNHLLISKDSSQRLLRSPDGIPEFRICDFEFLRHQKTPT